MSDCPRFLKVIGLKIIFLFSGINSIFSVSRQFSHTGGVQILSSDEVYLVQITRLKNLIEGTGAPGLLRSGDCLNLDHARMNFFISFPGECLSESYKLICWHYSPLVGNPLFPPRRCSDWEPFHASCSRATRSAPLEQGYPSAVTSQQDSPGATIWRIEEQQAASLAEQTATGDHADLPDAIEYDSLAVAAATHQITSPNMHSFRIRYIVLGLLVYIQSAFCRTCGSNFDDVPSSSVLATVVFEGVATHVEQIAADPVTTTERDDNNLLVLYNLVQFKVRRLFKGDLPRRPSNPERIANVLVGKFGESRELGDPDRCLAPLVEIGSHHIVFLNSTERTTGVATPLRPRDASDPAEWSVSAPLHYPISAFPVPSSKAVLRQVRDYTCERCGKYRSYTSIIFLRDIPLSFTCVIITCLCISIEPIVFSVKILTAVILFIDRWP